MTLAVCATPIGNLDDVTLRVLAELRAASVVLCEDTRRTRILLEHHDIRARTLSYHRLNEAQRTAAVLPRLQAGERLALASDAGLPAISDPGGRLITAALDAGIEVTVLPGPSAVETALVASGLGSGGYRFLGYLPRTGAALETLWRELEYWPDAAIAFESQRRLPTALASLARVLPARRVAVCRELTKRFETVVRGTATELADRFREPPKGEVTLVLGGAEDARAARRGEAEQSAVAAVAELVRGGCPRRRAADVVARLTGVSRNRLYGASL